MNLREVKMLSAGVIIVALVTTNFIVPAALEDISSVRMTAISKPAPIEPSADDSASANGAIPEPVRALSPAAATARASAMQAHADRVLAENGEGPEPTNGTSPRGEGAADGDLKCLAGCN